MFPSILVCAGRPVADVGVAMALVLAILDRTLQLWCSRLNLVRVLELVKALVKLVGLMVVTIHGGLNGSQLMRTVLFVAWTVAIEANWTLPTVTVRVLDRYRLPMITRMLTLSISVLLGRIFPGSGGMVLRTAIAVFGLANFMKLEVTRIVRNRLVKFLFSLSAVSRRNREMSVCSLMVVVRLVLVSRAVWLTWLTSLRCWLRVLGRIARCRYDVVVKRKLTSMNMSMAIDTECNECDFLGPLISVQLLVRVLVTTSLSRPLGRRRPMTKLLRLAVFV